MWPINTSNCRYVLELDVTPSALICENIIFICFRNGTVRCLMRKGSSNIQRTEQNKDVFDGDVQKRANWRRIEESKQRRAFLIAEEEDLVGVLTEEEAASVRNMITNVVRKVREHHEQNLLNTYKNCMYLLNCLDGRRN